MKSLTIALLTMSLMLIPACGDKEVSGEDTSEE